MPLCFQLRKWRLKTSPLTAKAERDLCASLLTDLAIATQSVPQTETVEDWLDTNAGHAARSQRHERNNQLESEHLDEQVRACKRSCKGFSRINARARQCDKSNAAANEDKRVSLKI